MQYEFGSVLSMKWVNVFSIIFAILLVQGCATPTASHYQAKDVGKKYAVSYGVIASVSTVTISNDSPNGVGAMTGVLVGGVVGSALGEGRGSTIYSIIGATVGGIIGEAIENRSQVRSGQELMIRLEGGDVISVIQGDLPSENKFSVGVKVKVLRRGARVIVLRIL